MRLEEWKLALDALRANKLRAFLTMLGVVIGSACIVLVVTVSLAGRAYILGQIEGVGANLVYGELVRSGGRAVTLADEITLEDLQAIRRQIPQVVAVAGTHEVPLTIDLGGRVLPITVVAVTRDFARVRNLLILQGRFFDDDDMQMQSKVCVITEHLAATAFPDGHAVGSELRLGELKFTVVGVFRERVSTFGQSEIQRDSALVPFTVLPYFTQSSFVLTLYAQADRPEDVPLVTREIADLLRARHRAQAEYRVQNLASILEAARKIASALTVVLLLIALIALVISGIGIMNIMLVTVTERTREIGIRRAVGARRQDILEQFLLEALLISGVGAWLGVALGMALPVAARPLLPGEIRVPVSWISAVVAFGVSCLTGLLFGYLPARRAAQLQPTESLRYE
jgi:putative ABC transport system permease protein